ncbi:hypothetical protein ABK040_012713 [Willaertia magna]
MISDSPILIESSSHNISNIIMNNNNITNLETTIINQQQPYIPPPPTLSTAITFNRPLYTVQTLQTTLKKEGKLEDETNKDLEKLNELKKQLVLEAKQNWVVEQQVEILGNKIRLLIKNHLQAEDMKTLLDTSFEKVKMKTQEDTQGLLRDEVITIYQKMFYIFRTNPKFLAILTRLVRGKQIDTFLQTVVFTLFGDQFDEREENLLLQLFESVLLKEYQSCPNIGEFMRSNTAFTKMLSTMLRRSAFHKYLLNMLKEPIENLINDKNLNSEINPSKVYLSLIQKSKMEGKQWDGPLNLSESEAENDERVIEVIKPRVNKIVEYVEVFLDKIFQSVDQIPYGVRFMCKKIFQYGRDTYKNATESEIYSLVGGLIFLRWINPAITTCDSDQTAIVEVKLSTNQRKNLTMICKVIQNLSNGINFGTKEKFMDPLNVIIQKYTVKMHEYMKRICDVDEINDKLELAKFFELSEEARTINISYNEVALIHKLCFDNIEAITSPSKLMKRNSIGDVQDQFREELIKTEADDLIYQYIQQLNRYGPPPEQVSAKNNYYFNLKLKNPTRIKEDDSYDFYGQTIRKQVKDLICLILRELPPLPKDNNNYTISDVLKAGRTHCLEKNQMEFANKIKITLDHIQILLNQETEETKKDFDKLLLMEIFEEIAKKRLVRQTLKKKIEALHSVLLDVEEKREFLKSQLEMYNTYFSNTLKKTFKPRVKQSDYDQVGPFTFKFTELEKKGVIASSTLPNSVKKLVKIQVTSTKPGVFVVVVNATGVVAIKSELDLNELLEKQANQENLLDFDRVTLSVPMLIHLLNKLFVLGENPSKKTKLKKPKRRSVTFVNSKPEKE